MANYKKFGRNWALIAKKIQGRNGKQVRERFVNYLEKKANLQIDKFTDAEDDLIMKYFDLYPHDWNKIAAYISSKTSAQIKKRYSEFLRDKKLETGSTMGSCMNDTNSDINQISEIQNGVGSLVDPLGHFFR